MLDEYSHTYFVQLSRRTGYLTILYFGLLFNIYLVFRRFLLIFGHHDNSYFTNDNSAIRFFEKRIDKIE
jgi:hypothetical protein